jgi:phosphoribosyl-ATP pyrophosphohydrolase/phosphoribosyl-AMP cyclohydrolase
MSIQTFHTSKIDWNKGNGLVPAIIQDSHTGKVLMLAYMNEAALKQTIDTQKVTFYSRSKKRLWVKGETSGNFLQLKSITSDCDGDTLLIFVEPKGPACHLKTETCFQESFMPFLQKLEGIIALRAQSPSKGSYTSRLLSQGLDRMAQKVGEESIETIVAALKEDDSALCNEAADLLFHVLVLLYSRQLSFNDVIKVLERRHEQKNSVG